MTAPQLHLPRTVVSDQTERAVDLLGHYFTSRTFIGSQWDGFDPSGTRAASANVFTSDDVASAARLNTPVPGRAVVHLLITQSERFSELLRAVGPDRDFIDVDPDPSGKDMAPLWLVESLTPAGPETLPVLHLSAGRVEDLRARFPFCGCDACDDGSDRLLDELDDAITRVIADTESTAHRLWFGER